MWLFACVWWWPLTCGFDIACGGVSCMKECGKICMRKTCGGTFTYTVNNQVVFEIHKVGNIGIIVNFIFSHIFSLLLY